VNTPGGVPSIVSVFGVASLSTSWGSGPVVSTKNAADPTYGTGGILWASLTLALPHGHRWHRESWRRSLGNARASLALGAPSSKPRGGWFCRPSAVFLQGLSWPWPARGRGGAPHITGGVKWRPPCRGRRLSFLHLERKLCISVPHLRRGLQSPTWTTADRWVFTTALLLLLVDADPHLTAIVIRNRLSKKFAGVLLKPGGRVMCCSILRPRRFGRKTGGQSAASRRVRVPHYRRFPRSGDVN